MATPKTKISASELEDLSYIYIDECLNYLKMDVLALEELTIKMSKTFFNKYKIHLHNYITASQCAYDIWKNSMKDEVEGVFQTEIKI